MELTKREKEILGLIRTGLSNGDIADTLFISPLTVNKHVENIRVKTGKTKIQLAASREELE